VRPVIVALSILALFALFSSEVGDPDTWQHLASGRYILQHHAFPSPDPYSFTTAMAKPAYSDEESTRTFNIQHELLAQIFLYLSYAAAGFAGLVILRCTLLSSFCVILGLAAWHRTHSFFKSLAAGCMAATVAYQFRADRPYLFTFVFLAAIIAILEYRRRLWLLPPLFFLWANTHGGFVLGWSVLAVFCAEALLLRWRSKPLDDERRLWLVAISCFLISGLNATGFHVIPVMLSYQKSVMQTTLWEWQRPALWPPPLFAIMLGVAAIVMLWARRDVRPADWLLLLVFGAASLSAIRNAILAATVAPLLIVTYLPIRRRLPLAMEYLTALGALALAVTPVIQGRAFQFQSADWKYPARAADFLLAHHISARMFNTWEFGAYLIWRLWPQERVFIDGRAQSETVYLDYQAIVYNLKAAEEPINGPYQALRPRVITGKTAEELLQQYGIEMILMDGFEFTTGSTYYLAAALADPNQTQWKLVYWDAQAMIFILHPPEDVPVLNPREVLDAMDAQCREHLRHEPNTAGCASALVDLFGRLGHRPKEKIWTKIAGEFNAAND
jgi:hypothetical protein